MYFPYAQAVCIDGVRDGRKGVGDMVERGGGLSGGRFDVTNLLHWRRRKTLNGPLQFAILYHRKPRNVNHVRQWKRSPNA